MVSPEPGLKTIQVVDLIHLDFGLRAGVGKDGRLLVHLMNLPGGQSISNVEWKDYRRFFARFGVDIIGVEELSINNGLPTSSWRFYDPRARNIESNIGFIRSGLVNAARKQSNAEEIAIADNIDFSIRAMEYRLRDISISYGDQLSHAIAAQLKPGQEFSDTDTLNLFLNAHSFLTEAGTLRDHLAALLALRLFSQPQLRKMSTLLKYLKQNRRPEPMAGEILEICDRNTQKGWLARLSALRDQIVHSAPISAFATFEGVAVKNVKIGSAELPALTFQIPVDPILAPYGARGDVLQICVQMARNMLLLTRHVVTAAGITPELWHFTDEDTVEPGGVNG